MPAEWQGIVRAILAIAAVVIVAILVTQLVRSLHRSAKIQAERVRQAKAAEDDGSESRR